MRLQKFEQRDELLVSRIEPRTFLPNNNNELGFECLERYFAFKLYSKKVRGTHKL